MLLREESRRIEKSFRMEAVRWAAIQNRERPIRNGGHPIRNRASFPGYLAHARKKVALFTRLADDASVQRSFITALPMP